MKTIMSKSFQDLSSKRQFHWTAKVSNEEEEEVTSENPSPKHSLNRNEEGKTENIKVHSFKNPEVSNPKSSTLNTIHENKAEDNNNQLKQESTSASRRKLQAIAVARLKSVLTSFGRNRANFQQGLGTRVVGTLFGHRRGHVHFAQTHIFNRLDRITYRDINMYNPLNISHPLTDEFLDPETRSLVGDGKVDSINMLIPQDCGGFNLGSFMVRRSVWTDRLLDIWWDPVGYEQKHMEWEHKEQDAFEYMYQNQPWIRPHVAFIQQRQIMSFPPGACGEQGDNPDIHYQEKDRDFLVNMAGCEWGRDCWAEMYNYRQLSNRLNRNPWEKFKDGISDFFKSKQKEEKKKE